MKTSMKFILKPSFKFAFFPLVFITLISFQIYSGKSEIKIKIGWTYEKSPGKMEIYEYNPASNLQLWETGEKKNLRDLPVKKKITDSQFDSAPGDNKKFVLVMKNESSEKKYFFAAPHIVEPGDHALGYKFKCLCVNIVFHVSPEMYWYRIVEIRISPRVKQGTVEFIHQIIGLNEKEANEYMKSFYEQMREESRMPDM